MCLDVINFNRKTITHIINRVLQNCFSNIMFIIRIEVNKLISTKSCNKEN